MATPGYIDVPGKGRRYQTADGRLFYNHLGPALTQIGGIGEGIMNYLPGGQGYENYYNTVADAVGAERRKGSSNPLGSLPDDYKYTELRAGGTYGSLPADYKEEELKYSELASKEKETKDKKLNPRDPASKPTLDRGDELSREINQTNLNSFVKQLEKGDKDRGMAPIQFRHGFNSNDLPGSDGTYSHGDANIMGQRSVLESRAVMSPEGLEVLIDGNNVSFPQSGVSPIADEADSARAVPVPGRQKLEGLSARSRAFLDHEGGILGALRAAEASQGYVRQGGTNYAITGEDEQGNYTFTEFKDKGLRELKNDPSTIITHEFMDQYAEGDRPTPAQAQNPEIGFTTKADLETMSTMRETPVNFGVGDGSLDQIYDLESNAEKILLDPVDWMSRYRGGR